MPCEFVTNFDARYPIILGGVLSNEDSLGYIQVNFFKVKYT
jgi:ribosome biogenesis protein BMS1